MATCIERDTRSGVYGMDTERMIARLKDGRLVYLSQQFGGVGTMLGGAPRYLHGYALLLKPEDTLATIDAESEREQQPVYELRPILDWDGDILERIARTVE